MSLFTSLLALLVLRSDVVFGAPQNPSAVPTTASVATPSATALTRRDTYYCDQPWQKAIEAQAWADAQALADEAFNWNAGRQWQDAMDLFMGKESVDDPYKGQIATGLQNERDAHRGNTIFPESVIKTHCGDEHDMRQRKAGSVCYKRFDPDSGRYLTPFASTWVETGSFWNNYYIVLCPRFFAEKDSLFHTLAQMNTGVIDRTNASAYKYTWGHTYYHELMHLDWLVSSPAAVDYTYGACNCAQLARDRGPINGLWPKSRIGSNADTLGNAESWGLFASAAYFQRAWSMNSPGQLDCSEGVNDNLVDSYWLGATNRTDDTFNAVTIPDQDPANSPAADAPTPSIPFFPGAPTPTGLAKPFTDAVSYFSSLASSLSVVATTDTLTLSAGAYATQSTSQNTMSTVTGAPSACQGNQIEGCCTQGSFPTATPDSGNLGAPECNKVDAVGSAFLRINATQAQRAAADWCSSLIAASVVLSADSTAPPPNFVRGAAENGGALALSVLFDVDSCPTDGKMSTLDFRKLGQQKCVTDLYGAISEICAQDSTWADYNPNFTLEGGVYGNDCGLWGMTGQASAS